MQNQAIRKLVPALKAPGQGFKNFMKVLDRGR
jgi:hypothetical protein